MRPDMGRVQAVHVTAETEADAEVGVLESHGTRDAISDCVGLDCGSFEGDDCVWDGSGRGLSFGIVTDGCGRLCGFSLST